MNSDRGVDHDEPVTGEVAVVFFGFDPDEGRNGVRGQGQLEGCVIYTFDSVNLWGAWKRHD